MWNAKTWKSLNLDLDIHLLHEKEAAEILGLPDDVMQVALVPVAYSVGSDFKRAKREPVAGITHWNKW